MELPYKTFLNYILYPVSVLPLEAAWTDRKGCWHLYWDPLINLGLYLWTQPLAADVGLEYFIGHVPAFDIWPWLLTSASCEYRKTGLLPLHVADLGWFSAPVVLGTWGVNPQMGAVSTSRVILKKWNRSLVICVFFMASVILEQLTLLLLCLNC